MLLTFTSLFWTKITKIFIFFCFQHFSWKKWSVHESNFQKNLVNVSSMIQTWYYVYCKLLKFTSFFFGKFIHKHFTYFLFFNIFLEKSEVFMSKIFKKKLVNVSCMKQTGYYDCCMLLTFTSFFFGKFLHKHFTFFHFFNISFE